MRENKEWAFLYACLFLASFLTAMLCFIHGVEERDNYYLLLAQNTPTNDNKGDIISAIARFKTSYKTMFLCFWLLLSISVVTLFFFGVSISSTNKEEDYEVQKLNLEMTKLKRRQEGKEKHAKSRRLKQKNKINKIKGRDGFNF